MPPTLVELLLRWETARANSPAYTFLDNGEIEAGRLTWARLAQRARAVAAAAGALAAPGDRALVLHSPGLDFVESLIGCMLAGLIPVPAYPPQLSRREHSVTRLRALIRDAEPVLAITTTTAVPEAERTRLVELVLPRLRWLDSEEVDETAADGVRLPELHADTLALLQYTSGSTATPRGVMVSHANLLANLRTMSAATGSEPDSVIVSWLPPFHDMGLVGMVLHAMFKGAHCVLMAPESFVQRPRRWLAAITRYGGHISAAPNFAYDLCVARIPPEQRDGLDLSTWHCAADGSEMVRAATLRRFREAFEPCGLSRTALFPCYGLAEATLFVSGPRRNRSATIAPDATLQPDSAHPGTAGSNSGGAVSCGHCSPPDHVLAVDLETLLPAPPAQIGELWVAGPSVARGYWQRPEETTATFGARLADGRGPFLRTGDLGFLREGEVHIVGRRKDLIVIDGRNHYPDDIEPTVERSHPAVRRGCAAAFPVELGDEERLAIAAEVNPDRARADGGEASIVRAIRQAVATAHGVSVTAVVLLSPRALPKTSSGKVQRHECRAAVESGTWRPSDMSGAGPR